MFIYAFGSVCRGEIDKSSDIDILAITDSPEKLCTEKYSIYSPDKILSFWKEGNPFAWHLYYESKLIFSHNQSNYIRELGKPEKYISRKIDCKKFYKIFNNSVESLEAKYSEIFDLSTIYLATRNFATCYSLGIHGEANFSRRAALNLGDKSLNIPSDVFNLFERARILCSRGFGDQLTSEDFLNAKNYIPNIRYWFEDLLEDIVREQYERV